MLSEISEHLLTPGFVEIWEKGRLKKKVLARACQDVFHSLLFSRFRMFIVGHATQVSQPMKVYVRVDAVSFLDVFFMEDTKTGYNLDLDVALE